MSLKVGFVPEHFCTPIMFAKTKGFFVANGLGDIELIPYPSGSGHLIQSLKDGSIDIAIGLTEAFVRGVASGEEESYHIVGTYVNSPLHWAVSTGFDRDDIHSHTQLGGKRIGVSRLGSGSYVMSYILGLECKFEQPFFSEYPILDTFKNLRESVRLNPCVAPCDAFMWEYFTTKKYYDTKELKQIGSIYTPWPSWVIASSVSLNPATLYKFTSCVNSGVQYFNDHQKEAIEYICTNLDYSSHDAEEWIKTVEFNCDVNTLNFDTAIRRTYQVLKKANILVDSDKVIEDRLSHFVLRPEAH